MDLGSSATLSRIVLSITLVFLAAPGVAQNPMQDTSPRLLPGPPPFESGEEVLYVVNFKPLSILPAIRAGELEMGIQTTTYQEKEAYRISAEVTSGGLFRSLMGIDVHDRLESIMDRDYRSLYFLYQVRRGKKKRDQVTHFDYERASARFVETDLSGDQPRVTRNRLMRDIPDRVSDFCSVFYAARVVELVEGKEYTLSLHDNGRIKKLTARVEAQERIKIDVGRFDTVKVTTTGGFFRGGGNLQIWYTLDDLRIPVKFEADAKYGRVYGHMIRLQTPRLIKNRIRIY
jgi:hypothetical protein